jgi:CDP-paratose 2-epimerase
LKYFITGGCGFLGTNIAESVLSRGHELILFDNLQRIGSIENLTWLRENGSFEFIHGDIRNENDVESAIAVCKPDVIFHLAGQVAMTTSIKNPRLDFEVNALGTLNLLEAVRKSCPSAAVVYSSTNKVYGDLEWVKYEETATRYVAPDYPQGFPETIPLDFHSPYGCSKGAGDQYMLDYARIYGLNTVVFRHSSMYGGRQFATYDQGWVGWFVSKALEIQQGVLKKPFTINGNGKQVRDLLYAEDAVDLYMKAASSIDKIRGNCFNVGGGIENSSSLLELFEFLEKELNIKMEFRNLAPRESDQKIFVADISKAQHLLGWKPSVAKDKGVQKMIHWVGLNYVD